MAMAKIRMSEKNMATPLTRPVQRRGGDDVFDGLGICFGLAGTAKRIFRRVVSPRGRADSIEPAGSGSVGVARRAFTAGGSDEGDLRYRYRRCGRTRCGHTGRYLRKNLQPPGPASECL